MPVLISMLRGVNVGGNHMIKMDALRSLYASLGFRDVQTYVQSGYVVFVTNERNRKAFARKIEVAIQKNFGFHPEVILRTTSELKDVLARNPFAMRRGIEPGKLLINFMTSPQSSEVCDAILQLKLGSEDVRIDGREIYIYFPDGMGRSKTWPAITKKLKNPGTGRNLNTAVKLLEMAEKLEA